MARISPLLTFALLIVPPQQLLAQSNYCLRPAPPPTCSGFFTFELEYGRPLVQTKGPQTFQTSNGVENIRGGDVDEFLMWRLGHMRNAGDGRAIGASVDVGFSQGGLRVGVEGTKRYWTANHQALDLSLGVVQLGTVRDATQGETERRVALTGAVQYTTHDLIAAMVRADVAPGSHTAAALYGGVQLRSTGAILGTIALPVVGLALILMALSDPNY